MNNRFFASLLSLCLFQAALDAAQPLVWFCPHDYWVPPPEPAYPEPAQYMDLFAAGAPWRAAAKHTDVFKIYPRIALRAAESDLRQIFSDLNRRGIALGLEFGLLTSTETCGRGVEGFGGGSSLEAARRIKANGGVLRYIAMDEPYFYGSVYTGNNACRWTAQQVAENAAANLKAFQSEFPGVIIGDIEPVPATQDPKWLERYSEWMDAFRAAAGYKLAFFHADIQWHDPTWQADAAALERAAAQRGIRFGMIYLGDPTDQSDAEWVRRAEEHLADYELARGGAPQEVIFQTWHSHPFHILPDTGTASHASLIVRYFRDRTRLTLTNDRGRLSGRLTDAAGHPLAHLPLKLAGCSKRGEGLTGDYVFEGAAPSWASTAEAGFRMYANCTCSGPGEFTLHGFQYAEKDGKVELDFAKGLEGWTLSNPAAGKVEPSKGLHIAAPAPKPLTLKSPSFRVTPGTPFTLRIHARMPPQSVNSGFFVLNFLPQQKGSLYTLAFRPLSIDLGSTITGADGSFRLQVPYKGPDELQLRVSFAGSETYWPAEALLDWKAERK